MTIQSHWCVTFIVESATACEDLVCRINAGLYMEFLVYVVIVFPDCFDTDAALIADFFVPEAVCGKPRLSGQYYFGFRHPVF